VDISDWAQIQGTELVHYQMCGMLAAVKRLLASPQAQFHSRSISYSSTTHRSAANASWQ